MFKAEVLQFPLKQYPCPSTTIVFPLDPTIPTTFKQEQLNGIPTISLKEIISGGTFTIFWCNSFNRDDLYLTTQNFTTSYINIPFSIKFNVEKEKSKIGDVNHVAFHHGVEDVEYFYLNYKLFLQQKLNNKISDEIKNDPKTFQLKNVYANYSNIILQMKNDLLFIFQTSDNHVAVVTDFIESGISKLSHSTLGQLVNILDKKGRLYTCQTVNGFQYTDTKQDLIKKKRIKLLATSARSSFVVIEEFNENGKVINKLFGEGDDTFLVQNGNASVGEFKEINLSFENTLTIKDIQCGYFNTILLLDNGDVYSFGYNAYNQCGISKDGNNNVNCDKVIVPPFPIGLKDESRLVHKLPFKVQNLKCSSINTVFRNESSIYIIGDIIQAFKGNNTLECYFKKDIGQPNNNIHMYYFDFENDDKEKEYNDISVGGWHLVVYKRQTLENQSKSLKYFKKNLNEIVNNENSFTDINIE
ncbi:hypothetical protein ABK040_009548 [Willaertia magna]